MTKAISTYLFLSAFLFMGALATKAKDPQEVILANLKYLQVNSVSDLPKAYKIIEKLIVPNQTEINRNIRARSAKLRIAERI